MGKFRMAAYTLAVGLFLGLMGSSFFLVALGYFSEDFELGLFQRLGLILGATASLMLAGALEEKQ